MKYVALVRGVNVGGRHTLPKLEFKAALEELGFQDVLVYLNSGNAIFSSEVPPTSSVVQQSLEKRFGFTIPTLVLSSKKIKAIAAAIPDDWTNDSPTPDKTGYKSDVLYLFDAVNTSEALDVLSYKPDIETMLYVDGAVVTRVSRRNQSRGSLQKIVGKDIYKHITIRNINTARNLAKLLE